MYGFGLAVGVISTFLLVFLLMIFKDDSELSSFVFGIWALVLFTTWLIFKDYKDWTILVEKDPEVQE